MPFYHAHVRPELMNEAQRQRLAQHVVDVHCDVTGAPPSFVHVLVTEDDGEQLQAAETAFVQGVIRAGRNDAQKAEIETRIREGLAETAQVDSSTVRAATRDIQASYTMEGGVLLPEPGSAEERAWGQEPASALP